MKGGTLQIAWHDSKPVLTLDFHRLTGFLATGGADYDIKFWSLYQSESKKENPRASYESSLSYHSSAVNVLRFSPSGEQLGSGADGGELLIWKLHYTENGNSWKVLRTLSFHRKDILDIQWSPDGAFLISGSVDNSCIIWDANKGAVQQILDSHLHYVQGVAWDPAGQYVASLSSDRTCRIYINKPQAARAKSHEKLNYVCQHVIAKAELQKQDDGSSTKFHLFHDETLPSFFRRLEWSPDGSFLVVPAGIHKFSADSSASNTAYIFSRKDFSRPALQLPGASKPVVAVRFCPVIFTFHATRPDAPFKLPYRVVFAIATLNSLYIYDTESSSPIAIMAGLHYASITDIAWSSDAKFLAVSSQDGYCTVVEFEDGDLGSPAPISEIPSHIASYLPQVTLDSTNLKGERMDVDISDVDGKDMSKELKISTLEGVKIAQAMGPKQSEAVREENLNLPNVPVLVTSISGSLSNGQISTSGQEKQDQNVQPIADSEAKTKPAKAETEKPSRRRITPIAVKTAQDIGSNQSEAVRAENLNLHNDPVLVASSTVSLSNGPECTSSQQKQEQNVQPIDDAADMTGTVKDEPGKPSRRRIIPIAVEKL